MRHRERNRPASDLDTQTTDLCSQMAVTQMAHYPRDMHGYGRETPDPNWPGNARIAVQFVLNYEEGGENNLLHGDAASEAFLSEISDASAWPGQRHWNMESIYEYGARAGFWRLHRLFTGNGVPVTVFGVATALARGPDQVRAMQDADWEIASHGLKWIEYKDMPEAEERESIAEAVRLHREVTGSRPTGWYTGRCSMNTVRLVAEHGGFEYVSDSYSDDLPYWMEIATRDQLIVPYTLDANDMRFAATNGFNTGGDFFSYLKDTFDALYGDGCTGTAKMMSIGLHCRLSGRPGRIEGLRKFIEYAQNHSNVWFARRIDIARHWTAKFPHSRRPRVADMGLDDFIARFGDVFPSASWIAQRAFELERGPAHETVTGIHSLLVRAFRSATDTERLAVLRDFPDFLESGEAPSVISESERETLERLSRTYRERFGFPFIQSSRGIDGAGAIDALRTRLDSNPDTERATAYRQAELVAEARTKDALP